jgi:hypothetical protein
VSEHAEIHLDLSGIGGLLALSRQRHLNMICAIHFRADFGSERVFSLIAPEEKKQPDKHRMSGSYMGSQLFGEEITYADLVNRVSRGALIKSTRLSKEFDWELYQDQYGESRLPLLMINPKGMVKPFTTENPPEPAAGAIILSLAPENDQPG